KRSAFWRIEAFLCQRRKQKRIQIRLVTMPHRRKRPCPLPGFLAPRSMPVTTLTSSFHAQVLTLVPETARRILDIGCAAGRLGEAIKQRQAANVTGIELDESAAEEARSRLDTVVAGNIEEIDPGFSPHNFDCVVCGDILEHL